MGPDVWYVAYGSNLSWERFRCYLEGGRPSGSRREQPGARDPSPPAGDRPVVLGHRLYFAGRSGAWDGGGVAFVDPEPGSGEARGRAYRLTPEQLADVYAQENGREPGSVLPEEALSWPGHDLGRGAYRLLVGVEEVDGAPAFTITGPLRHDLAAPSSRYLRHVVRGLTASHGLGAEEIVDSLGACDGIRGSLMRQDLIEICR